MAKGLQLAEPPRRKADIRQIEEKSNFSQPKPVPPKRPSVREAPEQAPVLFARPREDDKVQFNKRVERRVADGYAMLAIRTGKKVPELLREAFDALEQKYGKV